MLAATYIRGTVESGSMKGSFIRSDSSGKATRGEFTATLIGPDTSVYTPAVIETVSNPVAETPQLITAENNETVQQTAVAAPETVSRFKDVTKLAKGIDPSILPRMAACK